MKLFLWEMVRDDCEKAIMYFAWNEEAYYLLALSNLRDGFLGNAIHAANRGLYLFPFNELLHDIREDIRRESMHMKQNLSTPQLNCVN
jgi:hypothetical protein